MKFKELIVFIVVVVSFLVEPVWALDKGWNSDLSKMMDGIEKSVGPDALPPDPSTLPGKSVQEEDNNKKRILPKPNSIPSSTPSPSPTTDTKQKGTTSASNLGKTKSAVDDTKRKDILNKLLSLKDNYLGAIASHGLTRWPKTSMPLKVFIEQESSAKGFRPEFSKLLNEAFQSWSKNSSGLVSLSFTNSANEAQIVCRFTDDKNELMSILEGGNTVLVPDEDGILSVDMKILTLPPPNSSTVTTNYMRRVCLHEAGHALGLTGHSPSRSDIMFATVYPNDPSVLTQVDINSLSELYKMDISTISQLRLDQGKALSEIPDKFDNPQVNAVRLNNEAAKLIKANQYANAMKKLLLANKIDPNNRAVSANLGALYANYGSIAGMTFNLKGAASYYKKAIPFLEHGSNKLALQQVLTNYIRVLKLLNKTSEAKQIEAKLAKVSK